MAKHIVVYITGSSDGEIRHHPKESYQYHSSSDIYLTKIASQWMKERGEVQQGMLKYLVTIFVFFVLCHYTIICKREQDQLEFEPCDMHYFVAFCGDLYKALLFLQSDTV